MTDRVLLVDDNLTNLQVLYQALEAEGYELLVAQSGEEAIEIAREAKPAVVLLDINLPDIDGLEVLKRIIAIPAPPAVVILISNLILKPIINFLLIARERIQIS